MQNTALILTLSLLCTTIPTLAHPGGVDKKGGHVDSKTGKYHLHTKPETKPDPKKPEPKKTDAKKKK